MHKHMESWLEHMVKWKKKLEKNMKYNFFKKHTGQ